jgi:carbon storage regulator
MLVLTRKSRQQVVIDNKVVITILEIRGGRVRLGISGPAECPIRRAEIPLVASRSRSITGASLGR